MQVLKKLRKNQFIKVALDQIVATHMYFDILKTDEAASTCVLFVQKEGLQMMTQALKVSCFTTSLV